MHTKFNEVTDSRARFIDLCYENQCPVININLRQSRAFETDIYKTSETRV